METFGITRHIFKLRDLVAGSQVTGDGTAIPISPARLDAGKLTCFVHGSHVSTITMASGALASMAAINGAYTGLSTNVYKVRCTKVAAPDIYEVFKNGAALSTYNVMRHTTASCPIDEGLTMMFATLNPYTAGQENWTFTARPNMRSVVHIQVCAESQANVNDGTARFITPSGAKVSEQSIIDLSGIYSHIRASVATLTPTDLFASRSAGTLNPATYVDVLL